MIYLDNAATSYPKPEQVYKSMDAFIRKSCANPGRGGHKMAINNGRLLSEARMVVAAFFGCVNPMQLVFTKNATEALNIAILGFLNSGDHVITSSLEHNSVMRPLKWLEKNRNVSISILKCNENGRLDMNKLKKIIKPQSKLCIVTISSNVTGVITPVKKICEICKANNITLLLDASQGAGNIEIDINELDIDMIAFPGHKALMGPQGTGGLIVKEGIHLNPLIMGGTGSNSKSIEQPNIMPDYFESGTLNTQGIVGLMEAVSFINNIGLNNIIEHKSSLCRIFHEGVSCIKNIKLYSSFNNNSGIIALNISKKDSMFISHILDEKYDIATRAGLHCAPLMHETLGTISNGIVRFSLGYFNNEDEVKLTLKALEEISLLHESI